MNTVLTYILDRLKERSTWLGIIGAATAIGISVSPDTANAITAAGVAVASLIAAITKG